MTFRVRTALVVLALTALSMGGAFTGVWTHFVSSQRRQLDEALLSRARQEAAEANAGDMDLANAPAAKTPVPKFGVLYGTNGRPHAHTSNFQSVPVMPQMPYEVGFDFDHDGVPMRGVVVGVGNTGHRVLIAAPLDDFEEDAHILARAMAIAFAVGCIWASIVAFGVATRLTRQHAIVGDVARRVASGDTSARVSLQATDSDLKQLADDLNAMIERLVGLLAVQERFIAHAAHELRTPLTSLRIELEIALRDARTDEDYQRALSGSLDSARRLSDLAEDLLALARSKSAPIVGTTPIEQALGDAVADVAPVGRQRDVKIVTEPMTATVRGDRRAVARLFRNVIENAVRFSPRGHTVHVNGQVAGEALAMTVLDEGPGIEAEDLERIFEPFESSSRRPEAEEGTGLGLAIARELARACGGEITARAGVGGRFEISLPLAEAPSL